MGTEPSLSQLRECVPFRLNRRAGQLFVEWCHLGGTRLTEPFFQDTIERCLSLPENAAPRLETPIEVLGELYMQQPGLAPSGFVFHMSRCGSTLLARMLAALPQNVVLSEAEPIDAILNVHMQEREPARERQIEWLRRIVSALAQPRRPGERQLFLKMDSWHALQLPLILEAFPNVPWIFLYREPVEVMVSHARSPGSQMLPGVRMQQLGLNANDVCLMPREELAARVLAAVCRAALEAYDPQRCRLVNYSELPGAACEHLTAHFGLTLNSPDIIAMRDVAAFHAKRPAQLFQDDRSGKQAEVTAEQQRQVEQWVQPLYARLEQLRTETERCDD